MKHDSAGDLIRLAFKACKAVGRWTNTAASTLCFRILCFFNAIRIGKHSRAIGVPSINVSMGGVASIGKSFYIRTGVGNTEVGHAGSRIRVGPKGVLRVGDRVGMSNTTIVCEHSVEIGDDVFIGGGAQIFDTNFHSTDAVIRTSGRETRAEVRTDPIQIGSRVFIGANAMICKGAVIGDEAIVAAGSVVVSSIPSGEMWGGNPARKIR